MYVQSIWIVECGTKHIEIYIMINDVKQTSSKKSNKSTVKGSWHEDEKPKCELYLSAGCSSLLDSLQRVSSWSVAAIVSDPDDAKGGRDDEDDE